MIALSVFRRGRVSGALIALFVLSSLAVGSCDIASGRPCTDIGCPGSGLDIVFDGVLAPSTTLDIQVDLVEQNLSSAPIITCTLSSAVGADGGTEQLRCTSRLWISQSNPRSLNTHEILQMVRVTISSNGTQLSQHTFTPSYTRTTPNGPDCGECVFSSIQVALPQVAQP
jgi:hypothetical protein